MDDQTPRRMLLPGVVLDPVWDEFDSAYVNQHGNYLFALSPRLHRSVTFAAGAPALGPLDTAMVSAFTTALPTITANIQNSVASAANYNPQQVNTGEKAFYRFSADWSVDSDGDGRFDWEEIIFDGNNPFAADSDGDGIMDIAQTGSSEIPTLDDSAQATSAMSALAATPLQPKATIEMLNSYAEYFKSFSPNNPPYDLQGYAEADNSPSPALFATNSYAEFQSAFYTMQPPDDWGELFKHTSYQIKTTPVPDDRYGPANRGSYAAYYATCRKSFRLNLDGPAPVGGYRIPLRLAKVVESIDPDNLSPSGIISVDAVELMLEVAAGQTIGTIVELSDQNPGVNQQITYVPATVGLYGYNVFDGDYDITPVDEANGVCITPAGRIMAVFNGGYYGAGPHGTKIFWQKRQLSGAGTMGGWSYIYPVDPAEDQYEGDFETMEISDPGIYQLQAVLSFSNGQQVEFPYLRMGDAKSIKNGDGIENSLLKAGKPDYFGVARNDRSVFVREEAIKWLGSTKYNIDAQVVTDPDTIFQPSTKKSPKCNLFVTHISNRMGATTSYWVRWNFVHAAPIAKDDWFTNPEKHLDLDADGWGFEGVISNPAPGMIVVSPRTSAGTAHGHVGFLDYDGSWINAGSKTVNKSVHLLDPLPHYRPNNFRSR